MPLVNSPKFYSTSNVWLSFPILFKNAGFVASKTLVESSRRPVGNRTARGRLNRVSLPGNVANPPETPRPPQPNGLSVSLSPFFHLLPEAPPPRLHIKAARPAGRRPGTQKARTRRETESAREKEEEREGTTTAWDPRTASPAGSWRHSAPWIFQALVVGSSVWSALCCFSPPAALWVDSPPQSPRLLHSVRMDLAVVWMRSIAVGCAGLVREIICCVSGGF
jgi:hypothetical protein